MKDRAYDNRDFLKNSTARTPKAHSSYHPEEPVEIATYRSKVYQFYLNRSRYLFPCTGEIAKGICLC